MSGTSWRGLQLALAMDYRVADVRKTRFVHSKLVDHLLPWLLGAGATGAFVDAGAVTAEQAQRLGLAHERVHGAAVVPRALELAAWLAGDAGQAHLFADWETAAPEDKKRLLSQVFEMDSKYPSDAQGRRGLAAAATVACCKAIRAAHVALDLHFAFVHWQINRPVQARRGGHIAEQSIDIVDPNATQHGRTIGIVQR